MPNFEFMRDPTTLRTTVRVLAMGGIFSRKFRASDKAKFTEKCRTGTFDPPDAKPLLGAVVVIIRA